MKFMAADTGDSSISIPLGITIGLLASFIQSLGLTIQRKSHVVNQALPEEFRTVEHRRPLWLVGFSIFISSNLFGSVFQIASLPVVILAPLGAVSLLWNAFFARFLLGDVFSPWMFLGTLLIAGGAVLIAIFGIVPEPTHSLEDLLRLFSRPAFIAYFSLLGFAVLVCLVITHVVEYSYTRRIALPDISPALSPLTVPTTAPSLLTTATTATTAADPATTERTPLIDRKPRSIIRSKSPSPSSSIHSLISSPLSFADKSPRTPIFLASSYASFSGIISGMCLLFAKSGVELLILTFSGDNQFWRWQAWVLVLGLVIFALLQLWYMHKGLVLADPTLVCPLAFCFYNLSSILNGLVYFDQFSLLSTTHLLLVLLGIFVLLAGVWVVSFPPTGGYGVDIGSWTEGEEPTVMETAEETESETRPMQTSIQEDEELFRKYTTTSRCPCKAGTNAGLGLRIVTTPPTPIAAPQISPSLTSPTTSRARPRPQPHAREQTDISMLSSVPRRARSSYTASTSATAPVGRHRRRTVATSSSGAPQFPLPLSPSTSGLGGFSIGLSPMSPGFSLVPRARRRASAALNGSGVRDSFASAEREGLLAGSGLSASPELRPSKMRRAVSDGGVGSHESAEWVGEGFNRDREGDLERDADDGEAEVLGRARRAKGRWKWVRGMFSSANR
ncbi:putative magnesium transporter NIPA8 [Grifola frondosa]|uniref:Putative magnesium transporter NIPA8 n=1 Tax=Grifola frondosa TaxID=5627 RepID=A0A1C7MS60_GRIFR|nr:putative magnesium transporter NIPA8 [Grifola frondosa]